VAYHHVRISLLDQSDDEVKLDLDEAQLERLILEPYRNGTPITINGKTVPVNRIDRVRISRSAEPSARLIEEEKAKDAASRVIAIGGPSYEWLAAARATDVTDEFITGPPGSGAPSPSGSATGTRESDA
jgi:hypothetical protein